MKLYTKTALYLIGASFVFALMASLIPDGVWLSDPQPFSEIDTWFSVMSVVSAGCAGLCAAFGWAKDNM